MVYCISLSTDCKTNCVYIYSSKFYILHKQNHFAKCTFPIKLSKIDLYLYLCVLAFYVSFSLSFFDKEVDIPNHQRHILLFRTFVLGLSTHHHIPVNACFLYYNEEKETLKLNCMCIFTSEDVV